MEVLYTHCAGLDVHKKTVVVCCLFPAQDGTLKREIRTFSTMTQELLALSDWLSSLGITHVALEATGEFWKPLYTILEACFTVLVVNAHHIKNVPGRKTDIKDAEWIATLLRHGLLRASFIPPLAQRDLRDLTRSAPTWSRTAPPSSTACRRCWNGPTSNSQVSPPMSPASPRGQCSRALSQVKSTQQLWRS